MLIRQLTLEDLELYLTHSVASSAESGRDGDAYYGPYSRDEPFPVDTIRELTRERWTKPLNKPGWRRAWGAFDADVIVGSGNVAGGELRADLHRVILGMGILRGYRRQGLGRGLLEEIIAWCRVQPSIEWLDLGVFSDNLPARALYEQMGFETITTVRDRFRVDGNSIDDIMMTLEVGGG